MDDQGSNPQVTHFQSPIQSLPLPVPEGIENLEEPMSQPAQTEVPAQPVVPLADDTLLDIKQQALTNLTPLVGQLDQTPEEKFKTTMMLIQASDNPSLIKDAYAAANMITDDKARAQALIDIVNEINYFTQKNQQIG